MVEPGRKIAYGVLVPGEDVVNDIPLIRVGDLAGRRVITGSLKRIEPGIARRFPRAALEGGEVLLSLVGTIAEPQLSPRASPEAMSLEPWA